MLSRLRNLGGDLGGAVFLCAIVAMSVFLVGCSTPRSAAEHDRRAGAGILVGGTLGALMCAPLGPVALACGFVMAIDVTQNLPPRPSGESGDPESPGPLEVSDVLASGSISAREESIVLWRDGTNAVRSAEAALVVNLESPTKEGERSFLIDAEVYCASGYIKTLRVSGRSDPNGLGDVKREWSAQRWLTPPESAEGTIRGICQRSP